MLAKPFSSHGRKQFTNYYVLLFYCLALYKWLNGIFLYQIGPQFFNTRFDGTTWLFMLTDVHLWLLDNKAGWFIFDGLFYSMPLLYWLVYQKSMKWASLVAVLMLIVNWIYVQCYTLFPTNSIEAHVGWLLYPFLLMAIKPKSFYFLMHAMRYVFLFFFASAAIWKLRQGGIFNPEQMSGILLMQHAQFLVDAPDYWYSKMIYWLIKHPPIGYVLYAGATVLELFFLVGFFTKKYDKFLIALFIIFLITDYLVMRIPYFEVLPLALPLLWSRYLEPKGNGEDVE